MPGHTRLLFLDDSKQKNNARDGMDDLVAIGGISVAADRASELNNRLNQECSSEFGLPEGEAFKWSPPKKSWFKTNLKD
ncbi:hypothetical protein Q9K01_09000 [Qipengyuania sp. DY56-A-20]|jgi:hypothetical protein|uniref:DUF3800 domain-containing protein n=1 Tax=Qipengyuania benthica TaxID=3067651 RepID=A0ABT9H8Y1_9SPHN|nr:hypothetical protein [Qipengyuania sp. DY56-A-20]MDP4539758.1 hypothetical protein [Qipengyuania sp. DY56-A-20]